MDTIRYFRLMYNLKSILLPILLGPTSYLHRSVSCFVIHYEKYSIDLSPSLLIH